MDVPGYLIGRKHRKKNQASTAKLPAIENGSGKLPEPPLGSKTVPNLNVVKNEDAERDFLQDYKFRAITDTYQLEAVFRNESPLAAPGFGLKGQPGLAPSPSPTGPPAAFNPRLFLDSRKRRRPWNVQERYAATQIQRCWRGYLDRRTLWRFGGAGTHLMARRLQRVARGYLGRLRAARALDRRDALAAARIQGLYWGWVGRNIARAARVGELNKAASLLQRNYRGRLARKMFEAIRFAVHTAKAIMIQRVWRGNRGKLAARQELVAQKDEEALCLRLTEAHRRGELLPWLLGERRTDAQDRGGGGARGPGAGPPPPPPPAEEEEEALLAGAHALLNLDAYRPAQKALEAALFRFPNSAAVKYALACCYMLCWEGWGRKALPRPDLLDKAASLLSNAWELDPERTAYQPWVRWFQLARRSRPGAPRRCLALGLARCAQWGNFASDLRAFATRDCYRRAENLLGFAALHNTETKFEIVYAAIPVFYALFQTPRVLKVSRTSRFRLPISPVGQDHTTTTPAPRRRRRSQPHNAGTRAAAWGLGGPRTNPGRGEAGGVPSEQGQAAWNIVLTRAVDKIVITQQRYMGNGAKPLPPGVFIHRHEQHTVIHEEEIEELMEFAVAEEFRKGRDKRLTRNRDTYDVVCEYIMTNLRPVSSHEVVDPSDLEPDEVNPPRQEEYGNNPQVRNRSSLTDDPSFVSSSTPPSRRPSELRGLPSEMLTAKQLKGERQENSSNSDDNADSDEEEEAIPPPLVGPPRPAWRRVYRLALPALQKLRDRAVDATLRRAAVRLVRRVYQGFAARAQWRRAVHQLTARARQQNRLAAERARLQARRDREHLSASRVAARVKGAQWRRRLAEQKVAALVVQMAFRRFWARRALAEARRRALEGLRAEEVFRKGVVVSGISLLLVVMKCGLNYKFIGHDAAAGQIYNGYVYSDQIGELLHETQQGKKNPVRPWQQERMLELLLDHLALVAAMPGVSKELADLNHRKTLIVHPSLGRLAHGPSIAHRGEESAYDQVEREMAMRRKNRRRRRR